jgi:hypothetical protein
MITIYLMYLTKNFAKWQVNNCCRKMIAVSLILKYYNKGGYYEVT